MAWFNNLMVGSKILVTVSIVLVLMVFQGIFSIAQLAKVNRTTSEMKNDWLPSIKLLGEIDRNINEIRRIELANINAKTAEEHESFAKRTKAAVEKAGNLNIAYEKLPSNDNEKKQFDQAKTAITTYFAINAKVASLISEGKGDEAYALNRTESKKTFGAAQEYLTKGIELVG